jgi:hypothetical protein
VREEEGRKEEGGRRREEGGGRREEGGGRREGGKEGKRTVACCCLNLFAFWVSITYNHCKKQRWEIERREGRGRREQGKQLEEVEGGGIREGADERERRDKARRKAEREKGGRKGERRAEGGRGGAYLQAKVMVGVPSL